MTNHYQAIAVNEPIDEENATSTTPTKDLRGATYLVKKAIFAMQKALTSSDLKTQRHENASTEKPLLRGRLHLWGAGISIIPSITLMALAPNAYYRFHVMVFSFSVFLIMSCSAALHCGPWGPLPILRRIDHVAIFVGIAGIYTGMIGLILEGEPIWLWIKVSVWIVTFIGTVIKILVLDTPRWIDITLYMLLGWCVLLGYQSLREDTDRLNWYLCAGGGVAYSIGALAYFKQWPDLFPRIFGPHEFFHLMTLVGFSTYYVLMWRLVVDGAA